MTAVPVVLLPGLDGTGDLFERFVAIAPRSFRPIVVSFPCVGTYSDLKIAIRSQLPAAESFVVLGESFSGPLALAIAEEVGERVSHIVVCNSFVSSPATKVLRFVPWNRIFRLPLPRWPIRHFFIGDQSSNHLVDAVRAAIDKTPSRVLAARLRSIFSLQIGQTASVQAPLLVLIGAHDRLIRTNVASFDQIASNLTVCALSGPHLLLQAKPEEAWTEISRFCARQES